MQAVVYIHGIVGRRYGSHSGEYLALRDGLDRRGVDIPALEDSVSVEWGWPTPSAGSSALLARAQSQLEVLRGDARQRDRWTRRLMAPLRDLVFYGWSDIAYYLDDGGKERIRGVIWTSILRHFPTDEPVDLTLIGHSAGALIGHDFLFFLFSGLRNERRRQYAPDCDWEAAAENWRIRRLVTLGSPFVPLLVRSADLVEEIATGPGPWLDPAVIGFDQTAHDGRRPLWLNVWDRHDILSFPAAGVYRTDRVHDLYPDHSDRPTKAHSKYWKSKKVHRILAENWDD